MELTQYFPVQFVQLAVAWESKENLSRTMHNRKFYIIDFTIYGLTDGLDVCMYGKCDEESEWGWAAAKVVGAMKKEMLKRRARADEEDETESVQRNGGAPLRVQSTGGVGGKLLSQTLKLPSQNITNCNLK